MEYGTYIDHLTSDGLAMIDALSGDTERRVPSCPQWSVADLALHAGEEFRVVANIIRQGGTTRPPRPVISLPVERDAEGLARWVQEGLDDLVATLRKADPEDEAFSWAGDHRAAFWARRFALETAVHRWDMENASGKARPIDSDLGADGVDEMFEFHVPGDEGPYKGPAGTVHLHRTDGEGEWVITLEPGALPTARRAHEHSDVAARASGSDLLLLVWRRIGPADVEVFGEVSLLQALWDYLAGPGV